MCMSVLSSTFVYPDWSRYHMSEDHSSELIRQLDSSDDLIIVSSIFPTTSPATLFAYWTQPSLITLWWPKTAEIDPRVGGAYHLAWPEHNWHLRGRYTAFEPDQLISFTWVWDHAPEDKTAVSLAFLPVGPGGTQLTVT